MEKEKVWIEVVKAIGAIVLLSFGALLAVQVKTPFDNLVDFQYIANLSLWITILAESIIVLLGSYILTRLSDKRVAIGIIVLFLVLSALLFSLHELDDLVFIALILGTIASVGQKIRKIGDLWGSLRKIRGIGSIVFFILATFIIVSNAQHFKDLFLQKTLEMVNTYMPGQGSIEPVIDQLIPPYITQQDLEYINSYLRSRPEWNYLDEQQKRMLLERMKDEVLKQKELIRKILKESLAKANTKLDKQTFLKILETNPQLSSLMSYLYVFVLLFALALFSIITEVGVIISFVLLVLPEWYHLKHLPEEEKEKNC